MTSDSTPPTYGGIERHSPGVREHAIRDTTRVMGWEAAIPPGEVLPAHGLSETR